LSDQVEHPLSHLGFRRVEPSVDLINVIDCYWFIRTDFNNPISSRDYLNPDGGMGIILNYCDSVGFEGVVNKDNCIFDGTNTRSRVLDLQGVFNSVGIRFKPAGASLFFHMPLNEIKNETISLEEIKIKNHQELYFKLSKTSSIETKVSIIEEWLRKSLLGKNVSSVVIESINYINHHKGIIPIASLVKALGYGQRRVERLFNAQVGMTPKEYATNLRIENARNYIKNNQDMNLTEVAYEFGYYDQAHFTNRFKSCMGITPYAYNKKV